MRASDVLVDRDLGAVPVVMQDAEATVPWLKVVGEPALRPPGSSRRFRLARGPLLLRLVDGSLLTRAWGDEDWSERVLAPLASRFLLALCEGAIEDAGSPCAIRGYLATKTLVAQLKFRSRFANEENVRQVARRLRAALEDVGGQHIIGSVPGRGYYLDCTVEPE